MKGITNAVVLQGGGGGGETVFAVNQTGEEVVAANKQVYLVRQMNFETKQWSASGYNNVTNNPPMVRYFTDNNFIISKDLWRYNENSDSWDKVEFSNITLPKSRITDIIEGKTVYSYYYIRSGDYLSCSICDLNTQRQFPNSMVWLGDGLALAINPTSAKVDIYPYDYETNTVDTTGEPLIILNMPNNQSNTNYRVLLVDGKILYAHDNVIDVYDRTTYSLIRTVQFPNAFMLYVTGFEPGDYVFGTDSTAYYRLDDYLTTVNTYKITENYSLEAVNDPLFSKMKGQKSAIVYNIETGVLQIGFVEDFGAKIYQFDKSDKSWSDITPIIDTSVLAVPLDDSVVFLSLSADKTLAAYSYRYSRAGATNRIYPYFFKLETTTGEWFAYNPDKKYVIPYQTLTGYTTGKTQDGKIEVATVLPPKVSLTVNVTPDPDTFEFTGAAE